MVTMMMGGWDLKVLRDEGKCGVRIFSLIYYMFIYFYFFCCFVESE